MKRPKRAFEIDAGDEIFIVKRKPFRVIRAKCVRHRIFGGREELQYRTDRPEIALTIYRTTKETLYASENVNPCVSFGEIIPEGRQYCPNCERG